MPWAALHVVVLLRLAASKPRSDSPALLGIHNAGSGNLSIFLLREEGWKSPEPSLVVIPDRLKFKTLSSSIGTRFLVEDASSSGASSFASVVAGSGALMCDQSASVVSCKMYLQSVNSQEELPRIMHAQLFGESSFAGDRDVRFVNCQVPCEFACGSGWPPLVASSRLDAGLALLGTEDLGRADLFPDGQERYARNLSELLRRTYVRSGSAQEHGQCEPMPAAVGAELGGFRHVVATRCLPFHLKLLGWTCEENCRYECMVENQAVRRARGERTVHYYGKWPFMRLLGTQELMSSLFSLLNGLPHLHFLVSGHPWRPPCQGQRDTPLWIVYAAVQTNTWLQSALFHARETKLFETLDYHSATLGLAMSLVSGIAMNLPVRWPMRRAFAVALGPVLAVWLLHVGYLTFFSFDYGYNMVFAVALGGGAMLAWLVWLARHHEEVRPFAWRVPVAIVGPAVALPLELMDFPPILDALDAHALWHLCTVPVQFLIYDCLLAKMRLAAASVKVD